MHLLVTVGTTKFDALIREIDTPRIYKLLLKAGFTDISFQIGAGNYEP